MTIRTWERRYGLPHPPRDKGGHRLYSQQDIETLQWLIARQADGLSIRNAADLWRALEAKGENPLQVDEPAYTPAVAVELTLQKERQATVLAPSTVHDESVTAIAHLCGQWIAACLDFDRITADEVLTQAFARYPAEIVCIELLSRAIALIGEGWYQAEISIEQEHFALALAIGRLESLVAAMPMPTRSKRVLVCCAPDEYHIFSPLLLTFFLLRKGWDVLYLGANVPTRSVKQMVAQTKFNLVIISAQRLHTAATLLDVAQALASEGAVLGYGGNIFNHRPQVRALIPGYFLGESLQIAVQNIETILTQAVPIPTPSITWLNERALTHYQARRTLIESHVWGTFFASEKSTAQLMEINLEMAQAIIAALKLGSIALLGNDSTYVEHLFVSYRPTRELLDDYLLAYYQATKIHLGEPAAAVVEWLAQIIASRNLTRNLSPIML